MPGVGSSGAPQVGHLNTLMDWLSVIGRLSWMRLTSFIPAACQLGRFLSAAIIHDFQSCPVISRLRCLNRHTTVGRWSLPGLPLKSAMSMVDENVKQGCGGFSTSFRLFKQSVYFGIHTGIPSRRTFIKKGTCNVSYWDFVTNALEITTSFSNEREATNLELRRSMSL